jgi:hypothetical protein
MAYGTQRFNAAITWADNHYSEPKGPFINYVSVSRGRGGGKISTYSYLGEGGQTYSYVIFSKSIFYIRNRAVKCFGRDHISFI